MQVAATELTRPPLSLVPQPVQWCRLHRKTLRLTLPSANKRGWVNQSTVTAAPGHPQRGHDDLLWGRRLNRIGYTTMQIQGDEMSAVPYYLSQSKMRGAAPRLIDAGLRSSSEEDDNSLLSLFHAMIQRAT
jgi:hypothetical protein